MNALQEEIERRGEKIFDLVDRHPESVLRDVGHRIAADELRVVDVVDAALVGEGVDHHAAGDLHRFDPCETWLRACGGPGL